MKVKQKVGIFLFGAVGYGSIEIICRGYTHWSMALAGGTCLLLMFGISRRLGRHSVFLQALAAAGTVTAIELAVGLVVNVWLGWAVWDYADRPLNLLGQICPLYSFFWFLLALPVMLFFREGRPRARRRRAEG